MDPASSGRGVRQLKTYLSTKIEEVYLEIERMFMFYQFKFDVINISNISFFF